MAAGEYAGKPPAETSDMIPRMRARSRVARVVAVAALAALGCAPQPRGRSLVIVAPRGAFPRIEQAAGAERRVRWDDADPRDDEACTESFAATELKRFLPACLGVPVDSVRLADSLPASGDAIVLGTRAANPLIAAALKTAQGSSTVSLITTSAILAPLLPALGWTSPTGRALAVLAIAAGSMVVSHANDSYFWVVGQFSCMDVATTVKTHTVASLIAGLTAILAVFALSLIIL